MRIKNILLIVSLVLVISFSLSFSAGSFSALAQDITSNEEYQFVKEWGSRGNGDGQFKNPRGIAIDSDDNIYVADTYNDRIQKFDTNGNFIKQWNLVNVTGSHPLDIFIDNEEKVNVLYQSLNYGVPSRVQQFDKEGNFITNSIASLDDFKIESHTTAFNSTGYKFSVDKDRSTIQIFSPIVDKSTDLENMNNGVTLHNETFDGPLHSGITDQI